MSLTGKRVLITGAARRIGKALALAVAHAGGNVVLHHGHSPAEAQTLQAQIEALGRNAQIIQADLDDPQQVSEIIPQALSFGPLYGLVNNASIFEALSLDSTTLDQWDQHLRVNLTAPFILSQHFGAQLGSKNPGRIINILDWRALRPGADHLPYTISKAALAALTRSLAVALSPNITVNGLALGAILPPADGGHAAKIINDVPAQCWGNVEQVSEGLVFLLSGPDYITGEIIHLDGGRHLI